MPYNLTLTIKLLVSLVEKGILVPKDYDELLTVNGLYNESAMDSKVRLIIMPTEQCNFRCKYCYESYQKGEMTEENQKTLLKFLQRKISSTSKIQISWFGGEPIEAIHVVQRIMEYANRMCDKQNVQLISDMTTNAYNLDDVNFDMLYNLRVFSYQVTLDGLEEQHNKQRVLKND